MPKSLLLFALVAVSLSTDGSPQKASKRKIVCKTAENAGTCYWTHGRLSFYNGNPSYRLWIIGTHRILGIESGPGAERRNPNDSLYPEMPSNVDQAFKAIGDRVFADFEVCPLKPEEPGVMQAACIESAKNIVVGK